MDKQDILTFLIEVVGVVGFISLSINGLFFKRKLVRAELVKVEKPLQKQLQEPAIGVESLAPTHYESDITEFCYLNPEELADRFGVTVNTVLKYVNEERRHGYTFEAWSINYERYFTWKYCYLDGYLSFYPGRADLFTEYLLNHEEKKERCLKRFWDSLGFIEAQLVDNQMLSDQAKTIASA